MNKDKIEISAAARAVRQYISECTGSSMEMGEIEKMLSNTFTAFAVAAWKSTVMAQMRARELSRETDAIL